MSRLCLAVLGILLSLASWACGPRLRSASNLAQAAGIAPQLLEFHEDRFLAAHNEELALAWKEYFAAREEFARLWRERSSAVIVDEDRRREADRQLREAKEHFVKCAERLSGLADEMADEAKALSQAAARIPPR